jgi:hypothetical protein
VGVERVVVEDHCDVAVTGRHAGAVAVADEDLAVVDLFQPGEHPQGGGLAASGGADEDHEFAVVDLQVDAGNRGLVRPGYQRCAPWKVTAAMLGYSSIGGYVGTIRGLS